MPMFMGLSSRAGAHAIPHPFRPRNYLQTFAVGCEVDVFTR